MLLPLVLAWGACGRSAPDLPVVSRPKDGPVNGPRNDPEAVAFFAGPIRRFELSLTPKMFEQLERKPREYVPATVIVGTNRYESVGVHLKGAAGSSRSLDDKPALTLNFDKFKSGQHCFGLDKLHLNNSVQDDSYLNEMVASELYLRAGLPTARATHAWVTLNGRDLGLYVLKEGYDSLFLRRNFPIGTNGLGNLYDGGFLKDVDQELERDVGRGPEDDRDRKALVAAANQSLATRRARLERVLDVDRFATFLVGQTLTDDWDGYGRNRNNYRLYFPPPPGRAVFIPHGMDQLFREANSSVNPGWSGLVAQRFMEVPEFRDLYGQRLRQIATNFFTAEIVSNQLQVAITRLHNSSTNQSDAHGQEREHAIAAHRRQIFRRIASIGRQLGFNRPATSNGLERLPNLGDWEPRTKSGLALLDVVNLSPRGQALHFVAQRPGTVASFRTSIPLGPGQYVVTGQVRVKGLKAGEGAGLRISRSKRPRGLVGDREWTPVSFDFAIEEERDVELIAEFDADAGEAWFDLGSFKVTRR